MSARMIGLGLFAAGLVGLILGCFDEFKIGVWFIYSALAVASMIAIGIMLIFHDV